MNVIERINEIKKHFKNLSLEQFEINVEKAGLGIIKPSEHQIIIEDNKIVDNKIVDNIKEE